MDTIPCDGIGGTIKRLVARENLQNFAGDTQLPQHTHTIGSKEKEKLHSRMQEKGSNAEKSESQECKQKEKSLLTSKIRKQKTR